MDLIVEHGAFGEARQRRCKGGAAMTDIVERLRAREYRNGGESDDTPELINPDGPEAADLISEYRGALEKCREHNEFLAKLAAGEDFDFAGLLPDFMYFATLPYFGPEVADAEMKAARA